MMMGGFALMIVGSLMTLLSSLFGIIIGIAFITTGFFITHSLTSSSVGAESKQAKAHASSLYLLFLLYGFKYCRLSGRLVLVTRWLECHCRFNRGLVFNWNIFSGLYFTCQSTLM